MAGKDPDAAVSFLGACAALGLKTDRQAQKVIDFVRHSEQ
jgi:hypothetical protein